MSGSDDATIYVLAIGVVLGVGVMWAILLIRRVLMMSEHSLADNGRAIHQLQKLDRQFTSSIRNLDSSRQDLQRTTSQLDTMTVDLKEALRATAAATAEKHAAAIQSLRDDFEAKHEQIATALANISETLSALPQARQKAGESQRDMGLSKWRKDVLGQDPSLRFSVLWEWCSVNMLGILHRASKGWNSTNDLTANIPAYLEPEADVLANSILVIGTRQHPEKLAIPLRPLEESSDFQSWFESLPSNPATAYVPALVMPSNGHFRVLAKGANAGPRQ